MPPNQSRAAPNQSRATTLRQAVSNLGPNQSYANPVKAAAAGQSGRRTGSGGSSGRGGGELMTVYDPDAERRAQEARERAEADARAFAAAESARQKKIESQTLGGQLGKQQSSVNLPQNPGGTIYAQYNPGGFGSRFGMSTRTFLSGPQFTGSGNPLSDLGKFSSDVFEPFRLTGFTKESFVSISRRETVQQQIGFSNGGITVTPSNPSDLPVDTRGKSVGQIRVETDIRSGISPDLVGVPSQAAGSVLTGRIGRVEQKRVDAEALVIQNKLQDSINAGTITVTQAEEIYIGRASSLVSEATTRFNSAANEEFSLFEQARGRGDSIISSVTSQRELGGRALQFGAESLVFTGAGKLFQTLRPSTIAKEIDVIRLEDLSKQSFSGAAVELNPDILGGRRFAFASLRSTAVGTEVRSAQFIVQPSGRFIARNVIIDIEIQSFATGGTIRSRSFSGGISGLSTESSGAAKLFTGGLGTEIPGQAFTGTSVEFNRGLTRQSPQVFGSIVRQVREGNIFGIQSVTSLRATRFKGTPIIDVFSSQRALNIESVQGVFAGRTTVLYKVGGFADDDLLSFGSSGIFTTQKKTRYATGLETGITQLQNRPINSNLVSTPKTSPALIPVSKNSLTTNSLNLESTQRTVFTTLQLQVRQRESSVLQFQKLSFSALSLNAIKPVSRIGSGSRGSSALLSLQTPGLTTPTAQSYKFSSGFAASPLKFSSSIFRPSNFVRPPRFLDVPNSLFLNTRPGKSSNLFGKFNARYSPSLTASTFKLSGIVPKRFRGGTVDPFSTRVLPTTRRRKRRK